MPQNEETFLPTLRAEKYICFFYPDKTFGAI